MARWSDEIRRRLGSLRLSEQRVGEIADELSEHLEDRYQQLVAAGTSPAEAEERAWMELQGPEDLARHVHHVESSVLTDLPAARARGGQLMGRLANDLRYGVRSVRRLHGATAMAVVAFALGIGVTTAVFSVFYGVLLRPLPYPDAGRMVVLFSTFPACLTCPASYPKYVEWRTRNGVFEEMAGTKNENGVVTGQGDAERVAVQRATWTVPGVFKVLPQIGRWFTEQEDMPGADRVVVLGYEYWQQHFGGTVTALGMGITIDGRGYRIIGVMPPDYQRTIQLFRPLQMAYEPAHRGEHFLPVYARLKPGVTVVQAQQEMVALGGALAREFGQNDGIDVQSYEERVIGGIRKPLGMLMGSVSLVLLIACANIANLLLASGAARRREFATRAAIGATRMDLARQLVVESVALALLGGVLGLGIALAGVRAFTILGDQIVPRAATVSIDSTVLLFGLGLSLLTGVLCALWPVVRLDPTRLVAAVREGDSRTGLDPSSRRFGQALVVGEIALAFSLLVGAGLLEKDFLHLQAREIGFRTEHLVAFDLPATGPRYNSPEAVRAFYASLIPQLGSLPDVEHAAATRNLAMYNVGWNGPVQLEGGNPWDSKSAPTVEQTPVTHDYFAVLGMPVRAGRVFDDRDRAGSEPVAILTRSTAEKFWPGKDPIGRHVTSGSTTGPNVQWTTVIGVVDDIRAYGLQEKAPYQMFASAEQLPWAAMTIVLRVKGDDPSHVMPSVREVVKRLDPSLPVSKVQTLASVASKSIGQPRLISTLTSFFGGMAGLLAAVGVYGVMAYHVRRDRRQHGIRLALGADPERLRRLIMVRGVTLGSLGVAIGGVGAYWLTSFLTSILIDVKTDDPWIFVGAAVILLVVVIAACARPAFQAGRTDPMIALRSE